MDQFLLKDCIKCQACKSHKKIYNTASLRPFSELTPYFNFRISIDTKGPINPPSNGKSYIISIVDAFSNYYIPTAVTKHDGETIVKVLYEKWIILFGPPKIAQSQHRSTPVLKKKLDLETKITFI